MQNLPLNSFEKKVIASLKIDDKTGFSADADFLRKLNQNLSCLQPSTPTFYQIWFNGVFNGLAAAAIGVILLIGLNVLPPYFVNVSITGTELIKDQIVHVTLDQRMLWQQMATRLENFR
jgi:hypothetical protein